MRFKLRARQAEVETILMIAGAEYFDEAHFAREMLNGCAGLLARRGSFMVAYRLPGEEMVFYQGPYFTEREASSKAEEFEAFRLQAAVLPLSAPDHKGD